MLSSANQLRQCKISAADGKIGRITDIYFDDEHWTARYLVVNTEEWLRGRTVLISPAAVRHVDRKSGQVTVQLSKEEVRNSSDVDTDEADSRQQEAAHTHCSDYLYHGMLWRMGAPLAASFPLKQVGEGAPGARMSAAAMADQNLRSTVEVTGYRIDATDGRIGQVDDFLFDEGTWMLCFLVVDTRTWIPSKHVVVAPDWIEGVSWTERTLAVALNQRTIRNSPKFSEISTLRQRDEDALYAYYASAASSHEQFPGSLRSAKPTRHSR